MSFEQWIAIIANALIAFGYAAIGFYVAPKFDLRSASWKAKGARLAGLVFFITCALTHSELVYHAWRDPSFWMTEGHFLLVHVVQAIAAPVFLILANDSLTVRIVGRSAYVAALDERIAALQAEQAAHAATTDGVRDGRAQ